MPYRSVFISHAHADNEKCDPYAETLRKRGISLYYDRANPQIGHSLDTALERQIERANALIVMVTPAALTSFWVGREISMFFTLMSKDPTRLLIPVKLEPCELPTRLESLWWVDATTLRFEEVVEQLVGALHVVEPPTASPSVSATTSRPASDSPLHVDTPPQVPRYATVRPVPVTPDSASKAVERMPATPDAAIPLPTRPYVPSPTPVSQPRLAPWEPRLPQQASPLPSQSQVSPASSSRTGISRRKLLVGAAGTAALVATGISCATRVTQIIGAWGHHSSGSLLWHADVDASGQPVASNNMVYVWSSDGAIYAFDADTGTKHWTFPTGSGTGGVDWSLAVANGVLYASMSNIVYALNAGTGIKLWSSRADDAILSVMAANGFVYVGSYANSVIAFDARTGTKRWSTRLPDIATKDKVGSAAQSTLAVASGQVLYNSYNGILYALGADDGSKRWAFQASSVKDILLDSSPSSLAVANGVIYVSSKDGGLYALDAGTGKTRWRALADDFLTSPAIANGLIYVALIDIAGIGSSSDMIGSLIALDVGTGARRWGYVANVITEDNSPTVANGVVYTCSWGGLYALDANTGTKRWDLGFGAFSPVVANGHVYVVGDGLYAFNA